MLSNVATHGVLSVDLDQHFQAQMEEGTTFKVATSGEANQNKGAAAATAKAQARNVFHFVPYVLLNAVLFVMAVFVCLSLKRLSPHADFH